MSTFETLEPVINQVSEEIRALITTLYASAAYRKTYRAVLLSLIGNNVDPNAGAIAYAIQAAKSEHDEAIKISRDGVDHFMKMTADFIKAAKAMGGE
jgi:hypothetical protein